MKQIKKIGIAGAGVMGIAIGQCFAQYGLDVTLYDVSEKALDNVQEGMRQNQEVLIRQSVLTEQEAADTLKRVRLTKDLNDFQDVDLVIEAIIENMTIKQDFFCQLEQVCRRDTIFATNTSGLCINDIGAKMNTRDRYLGANWWTPAYIVPLVEMVRVKETTEETVTALFELLESIGKKPVVLNREVNGFIGNRIQFAALREALNIVKSGYAGMAEVDRVLQYGLGLRYAVMGPFRTADFGGLDTYYHISENLFSDLCNDDEPNEIIKDRYLAGKYGAKTGEGFYGYAPGEISQRQEDRDAKLLEILKITCS